MLNQHNSDGFERFEGEITLNGKKYKYVKRKYIDGNIIFLCIPYYNKMHLEAVKNNYVQNINDLPGGGTKKQDKFPQILLPVSRIRAVAFETFVLQNRSEIEAVTNGFG